MAGAPLADAADLATWLGFADVDSEFESRAALVVAVISDLARGEAQHEDWSIESVPSDVSSIVLMVAASVFVNPDGKTSVTIEEVTRRWEKGDLFSASQLATLRKHRPFRSTGGIRSVEMRSPYLIQGARRRFGDGRVDGR
ncbi:hypothetical protein [Gulosibacter sediminis]|uniref:hypothetical protein n=1 Tax=Gulosibacter sediminis TaxID=1729695 RepID=UPI0024A97DA4|nr:hypothetical protein [Gulosibacter sediminis]